MLVALALTLGMSSNGIGATDMTVKTTTVSVSSVPMPGGHGSRSSDDHDVWGISCFTLCGGAVAVLPSDAPIASLILIAPAAVPAIPIAGWHGPPDPYPPRPAILS